MTALVTGGGGGIGAAVVARVARREPVLATYFDHAERADALAAELNADGGDVVVRRADLTVTSDVVATFDAAEELGPITAVVNCVGGWDYPRLTDVEDDAIDASLALNLRSALLVLRESARRVVDGGRIVMLSSAAVGIAPARQVTYVAAKAGVEGAVRVAAKELAKRQITVNVVRPGSTDTETLHRTTAEKAVAAMSAANAMRRLGTPDDVAGAVDLMLSPDSSWVTGQIIGADGGLY
ncbi:SDR family NAD(P)-dependent oxidoreductase [Gordonia sp. (in: high G+C Gram-positive bacteria)]|uniref:SDR family NAD(P)-dependent oxidoreductase n=1 Tax=Gordonia sp. (in: high G+C Gram-positive bacteria) TaxID=84139 RepID=UPI003F95A3B6